jgi:hypothetical protein
MPSVSVSFIQPAFIFYVKKIFYIFYPLYFTQRNSSQLLSTIWPEESRAPGNISGFYGSYGPVSTMTSEQCQSLSLRCWHFYAPGWLGSSVNKYYLPVWMWDNPSILSACHQLCAPGRLAIWYEWPGCSVVILFAYHIFIVLRSPRAELKWLTTLWWRLCRDSVPLGHIPATLQSLLT